MKSKLFLFCLLFQLFYGCPISPRKHEIGVHWVHDSKITTIPMNELYEVLTNKFVNYTIVLKSMPTSSTIILTSSKERLHTDPHQIIMMSSFENLIDIQYTIDNTKTNSPTTGLVISYFLKGNDRHTRLFELKEPMEQIKTILINHFQICREEDFHEEFIPYPVY